jgi:dTDP-glucose 4,6-dehydratase
MMNEITGNKAGIVFKDLRIQGDPQTRRPDTTRAKKILDWEPKVGLREGLGRTVAYFRQLPE